ncbi:expressed unknown protein [Seminavis robusta]|uniref:Calcineurin-like phosphoesterase domain-containing protein n=1 Tax=Seminavis robusta TaxID=568900 RepID=A0A9N8HUJ9_9STRA|nr:expressed unknown protein [Seminavis robusta]|eukprot:Sro1394_g268920.1 n/a (492) ;mRNA; r:9150-10625
MMSSSSPDAAQESPFRLGYVTDVEGNLDYFLRYVEHSKVLTIRQHTPLKLELLSDCYFVFGGDAVDKGPGDIRLVRALVDLKRRYPDRVVLLVGNRDLNKLRLTAELAQDDMERPIRDIPPPHWDPSAPSLLEFLQEKLQQKEQQSTTKTTLEDLNTRVNRLHYMLQHTLGCPNTFEFRRQELTILTNNDVITDDQVLQSFLDEIKDEHGSLRQYLECAQVAVIIGHTLFCHGAVDVRTMQFVPRHDTKFENPSSQPPPAFMEPNVHKWTHVLNQYLQVGLDDHRQRPYWNSQRNSRGGEALMALQNRPAMWGRSIISNCYGDGGCITTHAAALEREARVIAQEETTNPLVFEKVCSDPFDASVAEWLLLTQNSIRRVVVGHKPTGDCPAVLSAAYTGVEIVSADTSFSDTSCADNRGQAVSVVELVGFSDKDNQLELRGVLRNGQAYDCQFPRLTTEEGMDPSVGDAQLGRQVFLSNNHNDGDARGGGSK